MARSATPITTTRPGSSTRRWTPGINFIDTADGYSAGESEEILGKALADGRRANVVLAVKFGVPFGGDRNQRGASRRWITEAVEGSLRRLQTDWIDLYQVGVPDPNTDIDETVLRGIAGADLSLDADGLIVVFEHIIIVFHLVDAIQLHMMAFKLDSATHFA